MAWYLADRGTSHSDKADWSLPAQPAYCPMIGEKFCALRRICDPWEFCLPHPVQSSILLMSAIIVASVLP